MTAQREAGAATPDPAEFPAYSRWEFRKVFIRKHAVLLRALFDPALKKRRMDAALITEMGREFAALGDRARGKDTAAVPRQIFMLWQQGWDKAPSLVQACAQSWQQKNPGWTVHLLDDESVPDLAPSYRDIPGANAWRSARSNFARVCLMAERGGVWADATLFCTTGLDDWLPAVADANFFMFTFPRPYRPTDSWFIASEPANRVMTTARHVFADYWSQFRWAHHYFWMHYLLEDLTRRDPLVADIWRRMPRLSALGPLLVNAFPFDRAAPKELFELIEAGTVPFHKLSHKWRYKGPLAGTPVGKLTGLERL